MTAPQRSRSGRHADRVGLPAWLFGALAASSAFAMGVAGHTAAQGRLTPMAGFTAGAAVALLGIVGLPSLSIRLVARTLLFVSAALLVRFGVLSGSIATGGQLLLAWLVAAASVLVLSDRIGTDANPPLGGASEHAARSRPASTLRTAAAVAATVVLAAVLLVPLLLPHVGGATSPGQGATLQPQVGGAGALQATSVLDMTQRPDLTDKIVFTVDSDRGTFWRGETFDRWNGRVWTRTDDRFLPLASVDTLQLSPDDLGARGSDTVVQRFRIETAFDEVIYAAPSAVSIDIDRPVRQRADGTLISVPLGRGSTYTVTSRRRPLSTELLRSVGTEVPDAVRLQYASPPVTTDRVRAAALQATAGAKTQYDKVLAIEAWMGKRVEYSLDAPLAPKDVDVVDHFLFDAEQGWCEQIASSMVVLARANGIPARLVTGFVPDEQDPVTGVFTVRERDSHAWAEVWFPEVGWVPFDPTADVPLAGDDKADETVASWILQHAVVILLAVGGLLVLAGPLRRGARSLLARRRARPKGWLAVTDARLAKLGARAALPRGPSQTATAHAAVLAARYRDDRLLLVGQVLDDALYAGSEPTDALRAEVDAVLGELAAADVPEPAAEAQPAPREPLAPVSVG